MGQKAAHLNISGSNARVIDNEVLTGFFVLTKTGDGAVEVPPLLAQEYLRMKPDDFTRSKIVSMIANTANTEVDKTKIKKALHQTWDTITIPKDFLYEGQESINTTIGRFLFNYYVLYGSGIIVHTKFVNNILNKSGMGKLDNLVGKLLLEDTINRREFVTYIDRRDNLGYWLIGMLSRSISWKMAKPLPEIAKLKAKLLKDNKEELEKNNVDVMNAIEVELVAKAKEILKDDSGMIQYDSGELNFSNNYKANAIMKGPVMNKIENNFDFIDTAFMDGIEVKDLAAHSNSILVGQYPASIGTRKAGYLGKKLLSLLQMVELDEPDSDCGTKRLIPITVSDINASALYYSYFKEGTGLIMFTDQNAQKYKGQTLFFRSPMSCISERLCSKCAGKLLYLLGSKQAGLWSVQLSHSILNLFLKAKHDSSINLYHINPDNIEEDL